MNVVTVAYLAVLRDVKDIAGGSDAAAAALLPVADLLNGKVELAFDHLRILRDAIERVRVELEVTGIATAFVGPDVHAGRAAGGVRGGLGRPARRSELPAQRRRRGGLGRPDRAPGQARLGRRRPAELYRPGRPGGTAAPFIARNETRGRSTMRAVVTDRYGPPDVLHLEEVERPVPTDDEVLVRVARVDRHPLGLRLSRGQPVLQPRASPASAGRGDGSSAREFAGVVEAIGSDVVGLRRR